MKESGVYWVYILRCSDNTLYTGISNDVARRFETHNSGSGAKYTRSRLPVELVYSEQCDNKSLALRREIEIKRLSKDEKLALIANTSSSRTASPLDNKN